MGKAIPKFCQKNLKNHEEATTRSLPSPVGRFPRSKALEVRAITVQTACIAIRWLPLHRASRIMNDQNFIDAQDFLIRLFTFHDAGYESKQVTYFGKHWAPSPRYPYQARRIGQPKVIFQDCSSQPHHPGLIRGEMSHDRYTPSVRLILEW